jgi:hypothetical protein
MSKFFKFGKISEIDVSAERTWSGDRLFLTFDIDWANDEVIADTHRLLSESHVSATFFATHESPRIKALCEDENLEVGLHPNFNHILDGSTPNINSDKIISDLKLIIPEAKSVRSHSTTYSSVLCSSFAKQGLTHDVNYFIPDFSEVDLKPWLNWLGITMVPYFWEDDVACSDPNVSEVSSLVSRQGIRVFDFHPIHVFLNTESLDRYERTRPLHQNPQELIKHRFEGYGTRSRLMELLSMVDPL